MGPAALLVDVANWSTILACLVLKLPQGVALLAAKSARGVSLESLLLELSGFIVCLRYMSYYNYPLPTYVEYPIIIVQDVILLLFVLHYTGKMKHALPYTVIFVAGWYMLSLQKWIIDLSMQAPLNQWVLFPARIFTTLMTTNDITGTMVLFCVYGCLPVLNFFCQLEIFMQWTKWLSLGLSVWMV
ncbi:solute carrier family 66 member 3 isoform X4 [Varanus komodoensis]|uniref:solute carrier family 66 member 3 isoform X4 n=1 Tax=Varanus komodoensis TaxID=61221 RepID=UPI001CF79139|nr:solute carrier family 66 member 3 isoform X4 [Varanus komodoensis]